MDTHIIIRDFYETENAILVSPHSLRKWIDAGEITFTLVDLRSAEEYEQGHIRGALNIPAYRDKDHNAYEEIERIVFSFQKLPKEKDIIVYCYSRACMTGKKIGKILAENNIFVKHLNIGWNEWRHEWRSWNHEHEWDIDEDMYIESWWQATINKWNPTDIDCLC